MLASLAGRFGISPENLPSRVEALEEEVAGLRKQLERANKGKVNELAKELLGKTESLSKPGNLKIVASRQDSMDVPGLRELGDLLKEKGCSVAILASGSKGRSSLLVMVSDEAVSKGADAVKIVKTGASVLGGSGGGKSHMAQAGGKNPDKIEEALRAATEEARRSL